MKDLITERFNGLTLEKWTILSFFALGYIVIYKYSFYDTLGIPWYISSTSPLQIVFGSIKLAIYISVSLCIIFLIILLLRKFVKKILIGLSVRLALLFLFHWILFLTTLKPVLILKFNFINSLFDLNYLQPFIYFMVVFLLIDISFEAHKFLALTKIEFLENNVDYNYADKADNIFKLIVFTVFCLLIIVGAIVGRSEANYIIEGKELYLSSAQIKDSEEKWFIVDYVGDKVLLIKDDSESSIKNTFKIVEYKDIKTISSDKYRDEIKYKVNNNLKKILGFQE
ncbi:hypothetical protein [Acinetobacter johnsonii]|uniref:hypothetical protein n=1 Tax=Acinetobacter johnsonii TaxID=40214 RepID=UPI002493B7CF|nr:hypothetical protein [Acinetobacter johnsonii]